MIDLTIRGSCIPSPTLPAFPRGGLPPSPQTHTHKASPLTDSTSNETTRMPSPFRNRTNRPETSSSLMYHSGATSAPTPTLIRGSVVQLCVARLVCSVMGHLSRHLDVIKNNLALGDPNHQRKLL